MNHEKALEAARMSGGVVDERAITAYLAAYGVRDLGALVDKCRELCNATKGVDTWFAEDGIRAALTAPSQ